MGEIKIFDALMSSEEARIDKISLVNNPAHGVLFSCFSAVKSRFSIIDDERRIVFGPVIIPDKPILRDDPIDGEDLYYVRFSRQTIRQFAEKFFRDKRIDSTGINHSTDIDDVYVVQSVIKGEPVVHIDGFDDLPDGTWFLGFKVDNDKIWQDVKSGCFLGFSPELGYNLVDSGEKLAMDNIQPNKNMSKTKTKFSKFSTVKTLYEDMTGEKLVLSKFGTVMTNRGELAYDGELTNGKTGVTLMMDGSDPVVADGEFVLETSDERNGRTVIIEDGTVIDNGSPEETEMQDDSPADSTTAVDVEAIADLVEADADKLESLAERIQEIVGEIKEDISEIVSEVVASEFAAIRQELKIHANSPKERPKSATTGFSGLKTADNYSDFFQD